MDDSKSLAIAGKVNAVIHDVLDCDRDDILPHVTMDDLRADSLDVSDIVMVLEDHFGIDLGWLEDADHEVMMALTVGEISEAVEKEMEGR